MTIDNLIQNINSFLTSHYFLFSIGCGSNENIDKNCLHQQYPNWFRSIKTNKVIILIDPMLEDELKLDEYLSKQIYKEIIKIDNNLYSAIDHFNNNITIITSNCFFNIDDIDNLDDDAIIDEMKDFNIESNNKLKSKHFKDIITHILNTQSKLFIQSFTGSSYYKYQKSFSKLFDTDIFYDNILFESTYNYDGDCYPDLNISPVFDNNNIFNIDKYNKDDDIMKLFNDNNDKQYIINKYIIKHINNFLSNDFCVIRNLINKFFNKDYDFSNLFPKFQYDMIKCNNLYIPFDILNCKEINHNDLDDIIKSIIYENINNNILVFIKNNPDTKQSMNNLINNLTNNKKNMYDFLSNIKKIINHNYNNIYN